MYPNAPRWTDPGEPVELRYYLAVFRRRLLLILAIVIVATAVAGLATPRTHKYNATALIYVGADKFSVSPTAAYSYDPTQLVDRLMKTYAVMLDSEPIAADAISATSVAHTPKQVVRETQVTPGTDTQLLTVTVTDRDPRVAQQLSNGLADAFMNKVRTLDAQPGPGSLPSLPAYIFQRPDLPDQPLSNGLLRNLALAAFFGLLVAVGTVLLLDHLDLTIRSISGAETRLHLPVLGFLPYNSTHAAGTRAPVVYVEPRTPERQPQPRIGA
jgi:capsular polysaccharide biosynthesis protein